MMKKKDIFESKIQCSVEVTAIDFAVSDVTIKKMSSVSPVTIKKGGPKPTVIKIGKLQYCRIA